MTTSLAAPHLPAWAAEMAGLYESRAASQFLLYGNVDDRFLLSRPGTAEKALLGTLDEFLFKILLPRFDIILSYDLGNGIRIEQGGDHAEKWSGFRDRAEWPRQPRPAVEMLTHFLRYTANLARLGQRPLQIAVLVRAAHLVAPAAPGSMNYDLHAIALLLRQWSTENLLTESPLATILLADNRNDLHPLLASNPRAAAIEIGQPSAAGLAAALDALAPHFPKALAEFAADLPAVANQLAGSTLAAVETLLRRREHDGQALRRPDLVGLKKQLVERDAAGLIEFIDSNRTLDDLHGQDALKQWLRQDVALWHQGDTAALPMGYLVCGPVGTGKTYLVECLAGEAGIPVVKLKNFRDKWIGSTEGNLERIFRLLQALGRCFVFVDEADQMLGRREGGTSDSGLSGRVYGMLAKEMSNPSNRGKLLWVLATSRPDLVEVDLKRPGRIDLKIPIFPTASPAEGYGLIRALAGRRGVELPDELPANLERVIPDWLTPGAAEALSVKVYRSVRTAGQSPLDALADALSTYQAPVARDVMKFQIGLAVAEATDLAFVPASFRALAPTPSL
jgi:ATPase family associated with various cellular activities (AAA)